MWIMFFGTALIHSYPFSFHSCMVYLYLHFTTQSLFFTNSWCIMNAEKKSPFLFTFHFQSNHRTHKNGIIYDYIFLMIHFLLIRCPSHLPIASVPNEISFSLINLQLRMLRCATFLIFAGRLVPSTACASDVYEKITRG